MRDDKPAIRTIKASEVRQHWSQVLNQVFKQEARILVEKSGIPVAAIISADDFRRFKSLEEIRGEKFKALEESWEAFKDVPSEEIEREVARAIEEVRAESRRRSKKPTPTS